MTAKEYLISLYLPNNRENPYKDLTEQECLDKLIASHKRIKGHFVHHLDEPLKLIHNSINRLYEKLDEI